MTNVNEMTFGIEIETTIPNEAPVTIGAYHAGHPVEGMPEGWVATVDGSIRTRGETRACEFVSPVLRGVEGLRSVIDAVAFISRIGGRVNSSCGFHVHVGVDSNDSQALDRITTLVANYETAIYASTGTKARQTSNWCRGVQQLGSVAAARANGHNDRYRVLNLRNVLSGAKPTVEFRAFAGTLNIGKIIGYIRLCVGMVERAGSAKRVTNWTAKEPVKTSPIHRRGHGQTHLTRLFYQLGWTKGRAQTTYGFLECPGGPNLLHSKRTLMALARKYDAKTPTESAARILGDSPVAPRVSRRRLARYAREAPPVAMERMVDGVMRDLSAAAVDAATIAAMPIVR